MRKDPLTRRPLHLMILILALPTGGLAPPAHSQDQVLLADDFSDPGSGSFQKSSPEPDVYQRGYVDGEYQLANFVEEPGRIAIARPPGVFADLTIAVDARLAGDTAGRTILLSCRENQQPDSAYRTVVDPDRRSVVIRRRVQGSTTSLAQRSSDAILPGEASNHIELTCVGDALTVTVNGTEIVSVHDGTFTQGEISLGLPRERTGDVRFANFAVRSATPPGATPPGEGVALVPPTAPAAEPVTPTPAPQPRVTTSPVSVQGWRLRVAEVGSARLFFQEGLGEDFIAKAVNGMKMAIDVVPDFLGVPAPRSPGASFFFVSRSEMERGVVEIGQRDKPPTWVTSIYVDVGPNWGTYYNADGGGASPLSIATDYAYRVEFDASKSNYLPTWFVQGVAEFAVTEISRSDPEAEIEDRVFQDNARVAAASRAGVLPSLNSLTSNGDWDTLTAKYGHLGYSAARLAMERLSLRTSAKIGDVLTRVGAGTLFEDAFRAAYGIRPFDWSAEFQAYVKGPLSAAYPNGILARSRSVSAGRPLQFVYLGLSPGEAVTRRYSGPKGRSTSGQGTADQIGYMAWTYATGEGSGGHWTLNATGSRGSSGRFEFDVIERSSSIDD